MNRRTLLLTMSAVLALALLTSWWLTRVDSTPGEGPANSGGSNGASAQRPPLNPEVAQQLMTERARTIRAEQGSRPRAQELPLPPPPSVPGGSTSGGVALPTETPAQSLSPDASVPFHIDRDGLRAAMQSKTADFRDCYEQWLKQNPKLAGRMVVGFSIGPDDAGAGEVTRVAVIDGGLGHLLMEGCVLNAMHDLRFDAPDDELTVHYPLTFSSSEDGGP